MSENPAYLTDQLITCLGNKRALLGPILEAVGQVKRRLGKPRLHIFDPFAGSGVVSRALKQHAERLVSNDLEEYAAVIGRCYLRNQSSVAWPALHAAVEWLNAMVDAAPLPPGLIETLYAPHDDNRIAAGERVFYTRTNARRLDNYRRLIGEESADFHDLLLGPLLSAASIHANTAGLFKGFYKDRRTGIGQFGGSGRDALQRILGPITLQPPVLSRHECDCTVYQSDANQLATRVGGFDLACIDPPYNQHPYGSNYFMLNLIARYETPLQISPISGIPANWQRSGYNVRQRALPLLRELLYAIDAPYLLLCFNDEGFIPPAVLRELLTGLGRVDEIAIPYQTFRGSRNLRNRPIHVTEHLFLVERHAT